MATVRDAIKARLSRLKDDVLNSTFIKGNVPSRQQQLQRVTPQFQRSVQPIARTAQIYGNVLGGIGRDIKALPQRFGNELIRESQNVQRIDSQLGQGTTTNLMTTPLLQQFAGAGMLPKPIQRFADNKFQLPKRTGIAQIANYNPIDVLNRRTIQGAVNFGRGMMFGDTQANRDIGDTISQIQAGKTIDPMQKAQAQEFAKNNMLNIGGLLGGVNSKTFKPNATGNFSSLVDKKIKYQISDYLSTVSTKEWKRLTDITQKNHGKITALGDLFQHNKLFKAYPEFKGLKVEIDPTYKHSMTYGSFDPNNFSIKLNPSVKNFEQIRSTLLHEIQHAIQTTEDFALGGNSEVSKGFVDHITRQKQSLMAMMENTFDPRQKQQLEQSLSQLDRQLEGAKRRAFKKYQVKGGEFEARAVEGRKNLTQDELTGTDPYYKQLQTEGLNPRDITNSSRNGVNQSTDPLIAEARKYKSAEEFVRKYYDTVDENASSFRNTNINNIKQAGLERVIDNNGNLTLYHGTSMSSAKSIRNSGKLKGNTYFAPDRETAMRFGRNAGGKPEVIEVKVDPADVMFDGNYFTSRKPNLILDRDNVFREKEIYKNATDIWNKANGEMMSKGVDNGVVKPQGKLVPNRKIDTYVESYANGEKQIKRLEDLQDKIDAMESPKEFKKIQDEINKVEEGNRYAIRELEKLTKLDSYTLLDGISTYIDAGARRGSPTLKDFYNYARVDESFIDSTPIQPQIDRTKLTGMQLETPNAKLGTSPATLKAYGRSELLKTPQVGVEKGQLLQPQVNPVSGQNPVSPSSLDNVIGQSGVRQHTGSRVPTQEAVRPPLSARPKSNTNLQGIESQPVSGSIPTNRLGQSSNGIISPEIAKDIEQVQRAVDKKVNLLDWVRTPDRVLEKIGLKRESDLIKKQYNSYLDQLPKEIDKITSWHTRVKANKGAEGRIFRYLDGQDGTLQGEELKVAQEMQTYLRTWADKLGLPEDKRIASYITHIFEKDFIQKEFDPDLAKLIQDKVPSSVYDPFLQERLGKQGYIEDAFQALDAYVKRATRKYNMDIALDDLNEASQKLDVESWNYVKSYADKINMRPAMIDGYLDNLIKQSPVGYKLGQRPVANISRKLRRWTYRGTLGLNFGSAVRNLTQGVNTYAQLGERWTTVGYMKALKSMATRSDELQRVGVLRDQYIQDRSLSSTKKLAERLDKRLFTFFELAEKINRGGAYFGAKSRALSKGLSEKEAIEQGLEMARKTQFTFGSVDTPVALQGDLVKVLTQFQSFNVKQTEFLTDMAKAKDVAGLVRWVGANALLLYTVGQAMGWEAEDFIPFADALSGERPLGQTPVIKLGQDIAKKSLGANDKYGQPIGWDTIGGDLIPFVPAGSQIKKTYQGMKAQNQGYSGSKTGLVRYPIADTTGNKIRTTLFGQYNTPEAREYFDKERTPLSKNQTEVFKQKGMDYYNKVIEGRDVKRELEKQKEDIKKELTGETGFKLPNPFKAKEAEASSKFVDDTFYYISGDSVKELDLSKYSTKPTNKIDEIRLNEDRFSDAIKVFRNEDIEDADKETLYGKLGVKKNDLAYYDLATDSTEVRREVVNMVGEREYKDRSEYIRSLASLRLELTSGKRVLTDNIIDDLYNEGLLSKNERNLLKNTKWEKGKSPANKAKAKKGKKAPKVKVRQVTAPSFGQINPIKLSGMVQAQPQQPRVNLDGLKLRVKRPQLKLSQSVRAGL